MGRSAAVGRTNGSIMRGVPLGVYYPPLRVRTPSLLCSWITHRNPVAGECSTFINLMISHLCRGAEKQGAFQKALDSCENPELHHIMAGYDLHPLTPSMDAVWTTHCAVRIVLESQDYYDALITAVNLGGDADTIGAVSGALAGAVWGLGSIPQDWLLSLIDLPALRLLAQELVTVAYD
jgi:ADP-ribosyl-[dinitrogen reductase] hydrolase